MNSEKNKDEPNVTELDEHCQKLIIQINGIIKAIAVDQFHFDNDKIAKITSDTLVKYNQLKGTQPTSLYLHIDFSMHFNWRWIYNRS